MRRTWLSIRVALATAIDDAFGRWDRAHLHEFHLADGSRPTTP